MKRCWKEYQRGLLERRQIPMEFSAYKIREGREAIKRIKRHLIDAAVAGDRTEVNTIVKMAPFAIAHTLGFKVVGVLYALTGDGLPQAVVISIETTYKPVIEQWVAEVDRGPNGRGKRRVSQLCDEAASLIDEILQYL